MKTKKTDEHRMTSYGSTNPSSIVGTSKYGQYSVYVEKIKGITKDAPELDQGLEYEVPIMKRGCSRMKELLGDDCPTGSVRAMGDKTFSGDLCVRDSFSDEEINAPFGLMAHPNYSYMDPDKRIPSNATPDFAMYSSDRARKPFSIVECKLRIYQDKRMKDNLPREVIAGMPGAGLAWYGEEMTNEVLPSEYDQCQWHMRHSGCDQVYLFAAFSLQPSLVTIFVVERDNKRIRYLEREVLKWHFRYIEPYHRDGKIIKPPVEDSEYCRWYMKAQEQVGTAYRGAKPSEVSTAIKYAQALSARMEWKSLEEKLKNEILEQIGNDEGIDYGELGVIGHKQGASGRRWSSRRFNAELAAQEEI